MNTNDKINQEFLTQYISVFADKLFQRAYENKTHLNGKDILGLSSIKQLNLFVIKAFFNEWQEEVKKLKSPLFDYKARDVRKSMIDFMNVLSQHISISQRDLKPYVERAVSETILLTKEPWTYLNEELKDKKASRVSSKFIKSHLKYIAVHKDLLVEFFTSVEEESVRVALQKAELFFDDLETDVEVGALLEELSQYLVIDHQELFVPSFHHPVKDIDDEPEDISTLENDHGSEELDTPTYSSDYFDSHEITEEDSKTEHEEQEVEEEAVLDHEGDTEYTEASIEESSVTTDMNWDQDEVETALESQKEEADEGEKLAHQEAADIAEKEVEEEQNLNQKFEEDHKTLAELHEETKIESVFDAISINHRYMFLQELFDGDNETFNTALKEVDACNTFDEAVETLVQNYAKEFFWDMNSDEVKELLKVVYRKFRA
jgi:hypothetical protein